MIRFERRDCVGCTVVGLPCLGDRCDNYLTKVYYCDRCKEEIESNGIYYTEEYKHICLDCLLKLCKYEGAND